MKMDSKDTIELALRAAHLAKVALELMSLKDAAIARLQVCQLEKETQELRAFLAVR